MQALNLPTFPFKIIRESGKLKIFDPVRRKYLILSPEEWVRQHFLQYLIIEKGFPAGLLRIENKVRSTQRSGRYDALFVDRSGLPQILIECKAPEVKLTEETTFQIARYNATLKVPFLVLTNGLDHIFMEIGIHDGSFKVFGEIPDYTYFAS